MILLSHFWMQSNLAALKFIYIANDSEIVSSNMLLSLSKWLQFLKEKNFKQTIPPVKIEDEEEITYEKATAALRRAVHFLSALQANDGHWPAENAGVLFFLPPLVRLVIIINFFYQCHHCN